MDCGFLNCSATAKDFRDVCAGLLELIHSYKIVSDGSEHQKQSSVLLHVQPKPGDQCRRPPGPVGFMVKSHFSSKVFVVFYVFLIYI